MKAVGFYSANKLNGGAVCGGVAHAAIGAGRRPIVIDLCPTGGASESLLPPMYRFNDTFGLDRVLTGNERVSDVAERVSVTFRRTWLWSRSGVVSILPASPGRTSRVQPGQASVFAARLRAERRTYSLALFTVPDLDSPAAKFALDSIDTLVVIARAGAHVDDELRDIRRRLGGRADGIHLYAVLTTTPMGERFLEQARRELRELGDVVHLVDENLRNDVLSSRSLAVSAGEGIDDVGTELMVTLAKSCRCLHCVSRVIPRIPRIGSSNP